MEEESRPNDGVSEDGSVGSSDNVADAYGEKGMSSDTVGSGEKGVSGGFVVGSSTVSTGSGDAVYVAVDLEGSEEIRVSPRLENRAPIFDADASVSAGDVNMLESSRSAKTRISEVDRERINVEMKSLVSCVRDEDLVQRVPDCELNASNRVSEQQASRVERNMKPRGSGHQDDVSRGGNVLGLRLQEEQGKRIESGASQYDSMLSMFDEFATSGKTKGLMGGISTSVGYGYEVGDMVWGKVKSHPWWPGHIFNEAFASSAVRRTKRPGHVLVAFFGDSSYGWFDPAELIPFDYNFNEKSQQTYSRNFVKAVEEAIDEISRRSGLGLACRCRNPFNFRPTDFQGFFAVDVSDCEPGGVYSVNQILKARNSFQPKQTLDFVKLVALMPRCFEYGSISVIKNKATALAYRKAVFEEFDETYAQAFGQQPVRPSRESLEAKILAAKEPTRAPLSGPMVIAEALGKKKSSTKANKAKETNKDRYLFKRRDEPNELKSNQKKQVTSSMLPAYVEESADVAAGDFILQKRTPAVSLKQQVPAKYEQIGSFGVDGTSTFSPNMTGGEIVTIGEKPAVTRLSVPSNQTSGKVESSAGSFDTFHVRQAPPSTSQTLETKPSLMERKCDLVDSKEAPGYRAVADSMFRADSHLPGKGVSHREVDDMPRVLDQGGTRATSQFTESLQQSPSLSTAAEKAHGPECHSESGGYILSSSETKFHDQDSRVLVHTWPKKTKVLKRPVTEMSTEKSVPGEIKKKRKKELGLDISSGRKQKRMTAGKGSSHVVKVEGTLVQVGLPSTDNFPAEAQKNDGGAGSSLLPDSFGMQPTTGVGNRELRLPELLGNLQALALNPFHCVERYHPAIVRTVFVRFRSQVFQKSLGLTAPAEMDSNETLADKSPAVCSDGLPSDKNRVMPSSKLPKPLVGRPGDPTKGGRKRDPSERQEELAAKKFKKIHDLKSLAAEKKAAQRPSESQQDGKESLAPRPTKSVKLDFVRKAEPPAKVREPTALVMKFPPQMSLPSGAELKARLARFGPLDHAATRIFWKTSTCRVVFLYKSDAVAANKHLSGNNSLFGNVQVRCHIREVAAPVLESESSKIQREDASAEAPQSRTPVGEQRFGAAAGATMAIHQSQVQLKSCLKRPLGDEAGAASMSSNGNGGGGRGTPRVKFVLGGEETTVVGEQLNIANRNSSQSGASFADTGTSSSTSSHGIDYSSKSFHKAVALPPPPSIIPPAPVVSQYPNAAPTFQNTQVNMVAAPVANVDIAPQMLSLLARCSDVVASVHNFLGYVPYHPL